MRRIALCVLTLPIACAAPDEADDSPVDGRVEVPDPPAEGEGLQFVMPETLVPAGEERMFCWIPEFDVAQDYLLTHFQGWQHSPGGHHVVALRSGIPQEPGTVYDCTMIEQMTAVRPLINPDPATDLRGLPDGYAIRMREGTQIVFQSHYINYTDQDILVADVARMDLAPAGTTPVEASYFILNHGGLSLPAGPSEEELTCGYPASGEDVSILSVFGHMHGYGTSLSVEFDGGGDWETIYDIPEWEVSFRDTPPVTQWAPGGADVLAMGPGDQMRLTCAWDNTSADELHFPSEMCASVATYYPATLADPVITCDENGE